MSARPSSFIVDSGPWDRHIVRRARKAGPCQYGIRVSGDPSTRCANTINVGDFYLCGDPGHGAGGYGAPRYCMECAGEAAREMLSFRMTQRAEAA